VAVLLCKSAVTPMPASIAECGAQEASEARAECAHDPAADHVQAPQQQGHSAHQIKKNNASHCVMDLAWTSKDSGK
jgi:hypothetical protein